jgi:hypothetical protein
MCYIFLLHEASAAERLSTTTFEDVFGIEAYSACPALAASACPWA